MEPREEFLTIAAQLWCQPQHERKEMDTEFATSIAWALQEAHDAGAARQAASLFSYYQDLLQPGESIGRSELLARLAMLTHYPAPAVEEKKL